MMISLDGKIAGDFLSSPSGKKLCEDYYQIHREFKAKAFLCGRKTMQESFTGTETPDITDYEIWRMSREDYVPFPNENFYAVALDPHCRLNWKESFIKDEDPGYNNAYIIEVLCKNAPDAYIAYLKAKRIAYIFAGEEYIDLHLAMHKLKSLFGIDVLLLEGGGTTGATFADAGLIDEYSLLLSPTIQGSNGISLAEGILTEVQELAFVEKCQLSKGIWLHLSKDVNKVAYRRTNSTSHDLVKRAILAICQSLGYTAKEEYRGNGWRADVYVETNDSKYAFEVQVSPQSLKKTQERQTKYIRDGITCCWLFEKEAKNMKDEFKELPLFQFAQAPDGDFIVSLKGRKELPLEVFIKDFLNNRIRFCQHIKRSPVIDVRFIEMTCWKCGAKNYIYDIWPLKSACNALLNRSDGLWDSDKFAFHPEIVKKINEYVSSEQGKHIAIGEIKERYSATVGKSYMSFGCSKCDAIFGDWHVREAIIDSFYDNDIEHIKIDVDAADTMEEEFPHWCHPGDLDFCE